MKLKTLNTMNWLNTIFDYFFGNDSKFFLIGAWLTAIFMMFGQFWSLIGVAGAAAFVYFAEMQVYGEWTLRDFKSLVLGALATLLLGILFLP